MVCIKKAHMGLILTGLILSACAVQPSSREVTAPAAVATDDAAVGGEAALERIPDPYLAQAVALPEGAAQSFARALTLMEGKDWDGAEGPLQALTEAHPNLSGPWVNLGLVHWHRERVPQAEAAFRRALEANALNGDARVQLAVLLRHQGRFAEAETLYVQALDVWPHNVSAHRNLGILYDLYMGRLEQALQHYEMAQKLLPEPDRELDGWVADLRRRLASGG